MARETRASTVEGQTGERIDEVSELRPFVEWLAEIVNEKHPRAAGWAEEDLSGAC